MTRLGHDGCWHCEDSLRHLHGLHGYFCRRVQDYRKDGCKSKTKRPGKVEPQMVFFHTKRLAREYGMTTRAVALLLQSLGLKKWSHRDGGNASVYYWDPEEG